jgi:poly(3-hydroxyalkanoate) synthetase
MPLVATCRVSHVLASTQQETLQAVGHSQGTTILLAALSRDEALAARLRCAVLLAPVAFAQHVQSAMLQSLARMKTAGCVQTCVGVSDST